MQPLIEITSLHLLLSPFCSVTAPALFCSRTTPDPTQLVLFNSICSNNKWMFFPGPPIRPISPPLSMSGTK